MTPIGGGHLVRPFFVFHRPTRAMRLAHLLSRLVRLAPRIVGPTTLAALALTTSHAANLPPELTTPLPTTLTLARGTTSAPITLADHFRDPDVPGSAVRITTRIGVETRIMDLALFNATAPLTVANFLAYVDAGRYAANFFHRSVPGFIIQTGGFFFVNDNTFDTVPTFAPVLNEPGTSNLRGTIAMAKLGPPSGSPPTEASINSATSGWFINLADNSANLDVQNGGFTVFGRVLGDGMQVADAIAALPRYNVSHLASAWTDLPLATGVLARANFVETSAARIAPLSFTAVADHPALVTATLTNGVLTLASTPENGGTTTIRLSATDLEGGVLEISLPVVVSPIDQSIEPAYIDSLKYGASFTPEATASSGLPVIFEVVSGPATYIDGLLTATGLGTVRIRATQAGNALYQPAEPVEYSIEVQPATEATIHFANVEQYYTGASLAPTVTTSPPGLNVRLTFWLDDQGYFPVSRASRSIVATPPAHPEEDEIIVWPTQDYEHRNLGTYTVEAQIDDPAGPVVTTYAHFTIRPAPLVVRPVPAVRLPGQTNPAFVLTYTHPTLGPISAPGLTKAPVATSTAKKSSPPGTYPITVTGGTAYGYNFIYEPGELIVLGAFSGTYEALLHDPIFEETNGKLVLTIPTSGTKITGRVDDEFNSTPITGSIIATSTPLGIQGSARFKENRFLKFTIDETQGLTAAIIDHDADDPADALSKQAIHPARLAIFSIKSPSPWKGSYTLALPVLSDNSLIEETYPHGTGHASATIDAKGVLKLTGKLADGVKLTASASTDANGTYRVFARPYGKHIFSPFVGPLRLQPHPDADRAGLYHIPVDGDSRLYWSKGFPITKSSAEPYRDGFGPIELSVALDPWLPPVKAKAATKTTPAVPAITLADRLGLVTDTTSATAAFGLDYLPPPPAALTETQIDGLPAALALTSAGKPVLPSPNPAKFALTVNPATGAFSGSFVLTDTIPAPTPQNSEATKLHPRKVSFSGILRQPPSGETDAPLGQGFFLLPALPEAASPEQLSGEIRLLAPGSPAP